jgi:hypothetical protein
MVGGEQTYRAPARRRPQTARDFIVLLHEHVGLYWCRAVFCQKRARSTLRALQIRHSLLTCVIEKACAMHSRRDKHRQRDD